MQSYLFNFSTFNPDRNKNNLSKISIEVKFQTLLHILFYFIIYCFFKNLSFNFELDQSQNMKPKQNTTLTPADSVRCFLSLRN